MRHPEIQLNFYMCLSGGEENGAPNALRGHSHSRLAIRQPGQLVYPPPAFDISIHIHVYVEAKGQPRMLVLQCCHPVLEAGSLTDRELMARLPCQPANQRDRIPSPCLPRGRDCQCTPQYPKFSLEFWGMNLGPLACKAGPK